MAALVCDICGGQLTMDNERVKINTELNKNR